MDRNLLSTIPAGVSAGLEDGGSPEWGLLGSQILAETSTGTHGPGALFNDGLTAGLRYVPVLVSRSSAAFRLYPNGSFAGPNPSSATYNLYEQGTGLTEGSPASINIGAAPEVATITLQLLDAAVGGSPLAGLSPIRWATYDGAAQLSETWGVAPTDSGLTESADGAAQLVLELPNTTRTSGQGVYLQLEAGSGAGVRTFGAVVLVD